ncbi:OmpH family outer membrane protein [Mucilaginibacter ginsenosidivorans]|uniref:OmpH family outer membrane protein n=1 Tax=Mucilaginibacter ginsenosidivorans TaxID=398053 RepID=A0A5B8V2J1_9SPHI|nr:OmpH family outer membrane protein [Mucilaginibacter ginsenosidivorans]QEC65023.1 OmpH family outer membrane protein [Mucilaginibacter ginsenosidivorans]
MKKLLKVALVAVCIVFAGNIAKAQVKIGYINFEQLIQQMPETKTIKTQLDAYSKQFIDQLTAMNTEYQSKGQAYTAQRSTMTDAIRTAKEAELADIQKRMNDYNTNAQQQVNAKETELSKPLFDKVRGAVAQVAKEKGYTYVINSGQTDLIVSPPGDDLMNDVKTKLGIK